MDFVTVTAQHQCPSKIDFDQFSYAYDSPIGVHQSAVPRTDEIAFNEIVNRAGVGRLHLCDRALLRQLVLIKRIELAGPFGFDRAALGLRGYLFLGPRDLLRRNRICSALKSVEKIQRHARLDQVRFFS